MLHEKCLRGLHPLKEIYRDTDGFVDIVVRWCPECGAVVIDWDLDNRTYPGIVMEMKLSRLYMETRKNEAETENH